VSTFRQVDRSARRIVFAFAIWLLSLRLRGYRIRRSCSTRVVGLPFRSFPPVEAPALLKFGFQIVNTSFSYIVFNLLRSRKPSENPVMSRLALKLKKSLQFGLSFFILHDARSIRTGTSFSGAIDGGQRLSPKVVAQCTLSYRSVSTIVCCAKTNLNRRSLQFVGLNRERITR
jgi:hypothetical protein